MVSANQEGGGEHPGNDAAGSELLTPGQVAELFGVDPKTVTRWANAGKLHPIRTLGGHRRFPADEVQRLLEEIDPHRD